MRSPMRRPPGLPATLAMSLALVGAACGGNAEVPDGAAGEERETSGAVDERGTSAGGTLAPEQVAFWDALQAHCGNAYRGTVSDATPYYRDGLVGREAVIHFFDCSDDRIHVPLHLDDDRSRNWIITRAGGTLRLEHDHRHEDGTEDEGTGYGGEAPPPGLPTRQIFPADAHTARILPERADNFWFLDFVDDATLQYGVHWPTAGHSVRLSFDLSTPVEPPPAPWGHGG